MANLVIQTSELSYHFQKGVQTLKALDLELPQGSLYGFLGPNGSGKTTTLSLLLGLLKIQQGSIRIFGQELAGNRVPILKRLGSLIESPSLYGHLTASENLDIYRGIYGVSKDRIAEVLKMVRLDDTGKKPAKKFSLGMKQRLSIALALLPRPELLILDEPTNGLDPSGIVELRELLMDLNQQEGMTILISSHILAEVERLVSHVGIIAKGKMVFQGTLPQLQRLQKIEGSLQLNTSDNNAALALLKQYRTEEGQDGLTVTVSSDEEIASLNRMLVQHGIDVYRLQPQTSNLEQLFINLTNSPS